MNLQEDFVYDTDIALKSTGYEVRMPDTGEWLVVTRDVWLSWLGDRSVFGIPYHGPVYTADTHAPFKGSRYCPCKTCQATVAPENRTN